MCFDVVKRELRRITSRPIYLVGILLVPAFMSLFFVSLLGEGLPAKVPAAIVDLDHTPLSRQTTRSLNAMELVDIVDREESYNQAIRSVQEGKIMGFFVIPEDFEKDAIGGKAPTITFYCNLTYYVPGSLVFKGFKTMAVTTSGRIVANSLVEKGISQGVAGAIIQPMNIAFHPLRNPWTNYSYYLSSSFLPGLLELMIFLMTAYSITLEINRQEKQNNAGEYKLGLTALKEWGAQAIFMANEGVVNEVFPEVRDNAAPYKNILFCGFDAGTKQLTWIKENATPKLIGSVAQDSIEMGYQAVLQCIAAIEGGTPTDKLIDGTWYNTDTVVEMIEKDLAYTDSDADKAAILGK